MPSNFIAKTLELFLLSSTRIAVGSDDRGAGGWYQIISGSLPGSVGFYGGGGGGGGGGSWLLGRMRVLQRARRFRRQVATCHHTGKALERRGVEEFIFRK